MTAEAQVRGKVWHVAVLTGDMPRTGPPVRALEQRLAVPAASRVAVLWNSENRLHREVRAASEAAAAALGVALQFLDVRGPGDLSSAFDAIIRQRADALLVFPDTVTLAHRKDPRLHRQPALAHHVPLPRNGG